MSATLAGPSIVALARIADAVSVSATRATGRETGAVVAAKPKVAIALARAAVAFAVSRAVVGTRLARGLFASLTGPRALALTL